MQSLRASCARFRRRHALPHAAAALTEAMLLSERRRCPLLSYQRERGVSMRARSMALRGRSTSSYVGTYSNYCCCCCLLLLLLLLLRS